MTDLSTDFDRLTTPSTHSAHGCSSRSYFLTHIPFAGFVSLLAVIIVTIYDASNDIGPTHNGIQQSSASKIKKEWTIDT